MIKKKKIEDTKVETRKDIVKAFEEELIKIMKEIDDKHYSHIKNYNELEKFHSQQFEKLDKEYVSDLQRLTKSREKLEEKHTKEMNILYEEIKKAINKEFKGININDITIGDNYLRTSLFTIINGNFSTMNNISIDINTINKIMEIYFKYLHD